MPSRSCLWHSHCCYPSPTSVCFCLPTLIEVHSEVTLNYNHVRSYHDNCARWRFDPNFQPFCCHKDLEVEMLSRLFTIWQTAEVHVWPPLKVAKYLVCGEPITRWKALNGRIGREAGERERRRESHEILVDMSQDYWDLLLTFKLGSPQLDLSLYCFLNV